MTSEVRLVARDRRIAGRDGTFEFDPHHCFACGELNEHGLHLQLHTDAERSWAELVLDARFQGWDGVSHGGIVCTILDEVMGWAVIGRGTWAVTARLRFAFRRPIPIGCAIRVEGRVVQENRRAFRAVGDVRDTTTDEVLATAEGMFVAVPPEQLERLKERYRVRRTTESADTTERVASASPAGRTS